MTRRSRLHSRSVGSPIQKGKITKHNNCRRAQPVLKTLTAKNQLVLEGVVKPCARIETPEEAACDEPGYQRFASGGVWVQPPPLPPLSWGSPQDVWEKMVGKERQYSHSKLFMQQHPSLAPRMRSIVLNWLMEVCEVYNLRRQTFYLAQDYFDRFMLTQHNIAKVRLQLIGVTCLFVAAKMEEIYPPKVKEFAFVTDGSSTESEVLQMELVVVKALNWNLCPETAVAWLKFYIQMASIADSCDPLEPQFPTDVYVQVTQLLDLCILDVNVLDFQYRLLAAAVLCHFIEPSIVSKVSGLSWDVMESCMDWMGPFVETVAQFGRVAPGDVGVGPAERHDVQTHADYLTMLDEAQQRKSESRFPTPPNSTEKSGTR